MARRIPGTPEDPTGTAPQRERWESRLSRLVGIAVNDVVKVVADAGSVTLTAPGGPKDGASRITVEEFEARVRIILATMESQMGGINERENDSFLKAGETAATDEVLFAIDEAGPSADPNVFIEFDIPTPREVRQALQDNLADLVSGVSDTMQLEIAATVRDAALQGETIPGITKAIQKATNFAPARARMIARTESLKAFNLAAEIRYEGIGITEQRWEAALKDDPTRPDICQDELHGTVWPVRGDHPPMPRHPNCRCTWIPIVPGLDRPGPPEPRTLIGPPTAYPWQDVPTRTPPGEWKPPVAADQREDR